MRRITCISMAGNPLADLKWFRGDEELTGAVLGMVSNKLSVTIFGHKHFSILINFSEVCLRFNRNSSEFYQITS